MACANASHSTPSGSLKSVRLWFDHLAWFAHCEWMRSEFCELHVESPRAQARRLQSITSWKQNLKSSAFPAFATQRTADYFLIKRLIQGTHSVLLWWHKMNWQHWNSSIYGCYAACFSLELFGRCSSPPYSLKRTLSRRGWFPSRAVFGNSWLDWSWLISEAVAPNKQILDTEFSKLRSPKTEMAKSQELNTFWCLTRCPVISELKTSTFVPFL